MKTLFSLLIFTLSLPIYSNALPFRAGTEGVGGGGGMVCVTPRGEESVELLEFWESENLKGMKIVHRDEISEIEQAREAIQKFIRGNPSISKEHSSELMAILNGIWHQISATTSVFLPPHVSISPPNDTIANFVQRGCRIEGIALYFDQTQTIQIDKLIYDLLSKTGKAGLLVHETIYRFLRRHYQVDNSISTRGITACLFTKRNCPELNLFIDIPSTGPIFKCNAGETNFVVFPYAGPLSENARNMLYATGVYTENIYLDPWRIQFLSNGGKPLLTTTYYELPPLGDKLDLTADGILQKSYSFPNVRASSSVLHYQNFPVFDDYRVIGLSFVMDPSLTKIQSLKGTLDDKEFACTSLAD